MNEKPILLVEDHPDDAFLTLKALKKHQLTNVVVTREGQEALDYVFARSAELGAPVGNPKLDFILLDLKLPKMDGFEFLEIIRGDERTKGIPVVILSSSQQPRDLARGECLGVSAYLNKPLDNQKVDHLVATLHRELPI